MLKPLYLYFLQMSYRTSDKEFRIADEDGERQAQIEFSDWSIHLKTIFLVNCYTLAMLFNKWIIHEAGENPHKLGW